MYQETTHSIAVTVTPIYLEEQSEPDENQYIWAYHVQIENQGAQTVQLISRHWQITDSNGFVKEVRGQGVIGEQPVLHPGETFEYTSGTPLPTPSGIMLGSYHMVGEDGKSFDITIPAFSLDLPDEERRLN
ncbi:MAG: Co2+/Mg2+ efflux protein ApaG [Alphaproteobacteria bacterium]|jgi:ApaG protein|nr:Co2+/Mg2+ efflux protein ApaG [Alphaproteobacteria bacterium]HJO89158.1 Co2+/Mg2+ efflux protein ApaG [Alphaproteobacteria bacterium]|tara:strand:- start:9149 stop:9541 length:393 start_codon:yes stop_codon:yes gene_type:complete